MGAAKKIQAEDPIHEFSMDTAKRAAEAIALVGRSGGQTEPGLYFEIRYKGQAVDPAKYCR